MAEEYKEFSREEAQGLVFHGQPMESSTIPSAQQTTSFAPINNTVVSRGKSAAKTPDVNSLVDRVEQASKQIKEATPTPEAPSAIHGLVDEVTNNWKPLAVGLGLGAAAMYARNGKKITTPAEGSSSSTRTEPKFAAEPPPPPSAPPQINRTLEESAALANSLKPPPTPIQNVEQMLGHDSPSAINRAVPPKPVLQDLGIPIPSIAPATPITSAPVQTAPVQTVPAQTPVQAAPIQAALVQTPPATPEITGEVGTAVSPKKRAEKTTLSYKDTPETWQKLTKEGTTFLPGYGTGDNHLFNTYGAEGRKAVLEKFNNGKPIGDYKNFESLNKKILQGVPINEVAALMSRLPAAEEAGNFGKLGKALKVGGIAGLGLSLSQLANAKNLPEALLRSGDIATDYIPGLGQFKQGMSPTTANANEAEDLAFQRRMEEASKKGAGNRGAAYDPRIFYKPMDTGNSMFNIGVAPPSKR